jgi:PleD family two-component response regulator
MHAFSSHLDRTLKSLDTEGAIDSETGLVSCETFWRELDRAIYEAEDGGSALSVARFSFEEINDRSSIDAARLFSRLIRSVDFACRERDGSILAAFTDTDLRSAHVVARRLAGTLRQTMIYSDRDRNTIKPTVTLATLKPTDNLSTLVARVGTYPTVAAG